MNDTRQMMRAIASGLDVALARQLAQALAPFAAIEPMSISLLDGQHIASAAFRAARSALADLQGFLA